MENLSTKSVLAVIKSDVISGDYESLEEVEDFESEDGYTIYYAEAEKALKDFDVEPDEENGLDMSGWFDGIFGAIEFVKEYEQFNFGEVKTDFSNPVDVVNAIWYIRVQKAIQLILDDADEFDIDDELTEKVKKVIIAKIDDLLAD